MNDLNTELETAIRGALATDAARAPRPAPQWDDLPRYADAPVEGVARHGARWPSSDLPLQPLVVP